MSQHKPIKAPRSLLDFERPRLDDPLYVENPKYHGFGMNPNDGLPSPQVDGTFEDAEAPDLHPDRFVCMEKFADGEARPPCSHYKRQLLPDPTKSHKVCLRYCTAIRDEGGEFHTLGDTEVLACEFRNPRDPKSEKHLAAFDEETMRRQDERRQQAIPFDPLKALEESENE